MKKKKAGSSVRELLGIQGFTKYGLAVDHGELLFFYIAPTNISVLSQTNISIKIHNLMMLLSAVPEIQILCTDSSECFDDNKRYLQQRSAVETENGVRKVIKQDIEFLDHIQTEMATARQFVLIYRCRDEKPEQVFHLVNDISKYVSDQGFDSHPMSKAEIKRFLALYFDASMNGDQMPDADGEQYILPDYQAALADPDSLPIPAKEPVSVARSEQRQEQPRENAVSGSQIGGGYFGSFGGAK